MKKIHYVNTRDRKEPFCANRVDMYQSQNFGTTDDKDKVTCKLCLMRLGLIEDTRGNWNNRTR